MVMRRLALFLLFAVVLSTVLVRAQQPDSDDESQFRFRFVGPRVGNRVAAIAGVPAIDTVKRWRFVPARQGDRAVAAWVLVPITFSLER